jgi:DNA-binding protein H-NS
MKQINSMNFDELLALKAKVEAAIATRVAQERKRLTASLQRLDDISGSAGRRGRPNGSGKGRTLAAKYRNPENPRETWAGRGLKPRWLAAALKGGKKKLSDFAIES